MDPNDLEKGALSRRCNSEPPLLGNRPSSTFTRHTSMSSPHSVKDIHAYHQFPRQKLHTTFDNKCRPMVRSSTFPILPSLNKSPKPQQMAGLKPINNTIQQETLPPFKNQAFYSKEKVLGPHQQGLEGRKFQLRSRFIEIKEPTPPKQPAPSRCNPLRKRVQEIGDCEDNMTDSVDEISEMYLTTGQSNIRRLSVITEKSNFSKTSKTLLFDLEDQKNLHKPTLPAVGKEFRRRRTDDDNNNNSWDNNSNQLKEHLQITGKQFNSLETKAALLSNWFQTLQTG